jgi:hypothetical protein
MEVTVTTTTAPPTPLDKRVDQYIRVRDHIKARTDAHKEELKPYRELLEQLNGAMLKHLQSIGADNVGTAFGTVYKTEKKSCSIADMEAFWTHVITSGDWDLVDRKANVTAVAEHIEKNSAPVPGVNFSSRFEAGVRRK